MTKRGHGFITEYRGQTLILFTELPPLRVRKNRILAHPPPSTLNRMAEVNFVLFFIVFLGAQGGIGNIKPHGLAVRDSVDCDGLGHVMYCS